MIDLCVFHEIVFDAIIGTRVYNPAKAQLRGEFGRNGILEIFCHTNV